jgi:hypothetical protein
MRRQVAAGLLTATIGLVMASPADAWWAEGYSLRTGAFGVVDVHAEPGETNTLTATNLPGVDGAAPGALRLHDSTSTVTPPPAGHGAGCTQVDGHTLDCRGVDPFSGAPTSVDYLFLDTGDLGDGVRVPAVSMPFYLDGALGAGDDSLVARDLSGASVQSGDGNDRVVIRGNQGGSITDGSTAVDGGAGDDLLDVFNGRDDHPACGDGQDTLYADRGETNADCETVHQFGPALP